MKGSLNKKIAIMGTRGVPGRYGGFETFAEELSTRLVERGHQVTVYGRCSLFAKGSRNGEYRGVQTRATPTIMHKYLETPLHAFSSFLDLFFRRFDVILLCNAANSPFAFIPLILRVPLVVNVDGIERLRSKWNAAGRLWYRLGEIASVLFSKRVIADAEVIAHYYRRSFGSVPEVIAYGAEPEQKEPGDVLEKFNLRPQSYLLYVSRLEPENNALGVIQAYRRIKTDMPLVIVGDAPYAESYKAQLREAADDRVIFTGFQFGDAYKELRSHCYLYVQATEVGGTHPALVEGMAYGNCIIANGTPENLEVLGGAGTYYWRNDFDHLGEIMQGLLDSPAQVTAYQELARKRAQQRYNWERVCDQYEALFGSVLAGKNLAA